MTTRLIREDELDIKVGDKVVSKKFPNSSHCTVGSIEIDERGIRLNYVRGGWDLYESLNKVTEEKEVVTKKLIVPLPPVDLWVEIPDPEPSTGFTVGERVWWKTAKTPNQPIAKVNYETISYVGRRLIIGEWIDMVTFKDGGWNTSDNIHHMWEPIS